MNCQRRYIHYPAIHIETIFPAWKYEWRYFLDDKETIYVLQSGVKNIWAISYNVVMNNLKTDEYDNTQSIKETTSKIVPIRIDLI
jgi:hypothetical protein